MQCTSTVTLRGVFMISRGIMKYAPTYQSFANENFRLTTKPSLNTVAKSIHPTCKYNNQAIGWPKALASYSGQCLAACRTSRPVSPMASGSVGRSVPKPPGSRMFVLNGIITSNSQNKGRKSRKACAATHSKAGAPITQYSPVPMPTPRHSSTRAA